MSDEQFVDFYQILELPLDADRDTLRKRINAVYLDAQGNLDHRNFATRLRFQELFESTLPQARFVLLDDARRAEYLILVRAFRAPPGEVGAYLPPLSRGAANPGAEKSDAPLSREAQRRFDQQRERDAQFSPEDEDFGARGAAIEPLPTARPDAEQLEAQRQELWKKWKAGLEEALTQQNSAVNPNQSLTRAASTESATSPLLETPARQREFQRLQEQEEAAKRQTQRELERQAKIEAENGVAEAVSAGEIEARRTQHRRDISREILVDVGLFWSCVGALLVAVPGVAGLIGFMGHNFPSGGRALSTVNPNWLWLGGFTVIAALSFGAAYGLSRAMRRRKAMQLAALSYEELLRKSGAKR